LKGKDRGNRVNYDRMAVVFYIRIGGWPETGGKEAKIPFELVLPPGFGQV
jgi:hypothetical protein